MFRRKGPAANELPLSLFSDLPSEATEVARLWLTSRRSYVLVGHMVGWTPDLMGSLLIECARTAAVAFASRFDMSDAKAFEEIMRGMDEERARMADESGEHCVQEGTK